MDTRRKAVLLWSGGKDSALALHHVRLGHPDLHVVRLVTCVSQAYDRVSMHGVRRQLVEEQSDALGLGVEFVVVPSHGDACCPMAQGSLADDPYSRTILAALSSLKEEGFEVVVFGDLYLESLRAYRDRLLALAGLEGRYPLWGCDPAGLCAEFIRLGYQAVVVCVDGERLPEGLCGQQLTPDFLDDLPGGVDPCGERGEYHTFVFDGPLFRQSIPVILGEVHRHAPFVFQELLLGEAPPATPLGRIRAGACVQGQARR
jgi:uncharacterized protein (TIGR00290 family)